jgi:hypothetical protein
VDVEGKKAEVAQMYTNGRPQLPIEVNDTDFWIFYDDKEQFDRIALTIKTTDQSDPAKGVTIRYPGRSLTLDRKAFRILAYNAISKGEEIADVTLDSQNFTCKATVDSKSRRVYALILTAKGCDFESVGVYVVPNYAVENEVNEG